MNAPGRTWLVEKRSGSAAELHAAPFPDPLVRTVWVLEAESPALVLGSTQSDDVVDDRVATQMGVEVARRHSGGGAVLVAPGDVIWIDVFLPADDPLYDVDVSSAGLWLGETWSAALADLGLGCGVVHRGSMQGGPLGSLVCFAGLGPGEVQVRGAKAVGLSQRRTRGGARFQCSVLRTWRPEDHRALLAPGLAKLGLAGRGALDDVEVCRVDVEPEAVIDALLARVTAVERSPRH